VIHRSSTSLVRLPQTMPSHRPWQIKGTTPSSVLLGSYIYLLTCWFRSNFVKIVLEVPKNLPFHSDGGQMQATRPWECRPSRRHRD
jgi:hypothetical protein